MKTRRSTFEMPKDFDVFDFEDRGYALSNSKMFEVELDGYKCYITKNPFGAWVGYIDVTDCPEMCTSNTDLIDTILPFHGGCTYAQWTPYIGSKKFEQDHFLIGCDWCHNIKNPFGIEDAAYEEVKDNIKDVVDKLSEFRLKMTIRGNNI